MQLWETIKTESLDNLYKTEAWQSLVADAEAAASLLVANRIMVGKHSWEVGEPLARYAHALLYKRATKSGGLPAPFTHQGVGHIATLIPELGHDGHDDAWDVLQSLLRAFRINNLLRYVNRQSGLYWIAPWPNSLELRWAKPRGDKPDHTVEKRIVEVGAAPVKTITSFAALKPPDPNPESVMAWVDKVMRLGRRIEEERDELRATLDEAKSTADWSKVVDAITSNGEGS